MKRLFWALVHGSTVLLLVSFITGYYNSVPPTTKAEDQHTTVVKSAIHFETLPDVPDPNKILDLVNELRIQNGLLPLEADAQLASEASDRSHDMVRRKYYAHQNPDGLNFFQILEAKNIEPDYACENLALESSSEETVFIESWETSTSGHKECMLNPRVTRAGYSVVQLYGPDDGADARYYVVVAIHGTE